MFTTLVTDTLNHIKKVVDAKRYDDFTPQKLKHVGPVQKRLGTRLRKLRNKRSIKHCLKKFRKGKVDKQDNK